MAVAVATKKWTLRELHSLPDDGNKYELIRGELFVTPPPSEDHETVLSFLARFLEPYILENRLGIIYRPRAVVRRWIHPLHRRSVGRWHADQNR